MGARYGVSGIVSKPERFPGLYTSWAAELAEHNSSYYFFFFLVYAFYSYYSSKHRKEDSGTGISAPVYKFLLHIYKGSLTAPLVFFAARR